MKIILLIFIWVAVLMPQTAMAAIIYVDAGVTSGANNGISWENAHTDLQSALDDAASGDEIWVAEGIYRPSVEHGGEGDRYKSFQMKNGVGIYGGFDGTEENRDDRDWVNNVTILSGDIGIQNDNSDNCYHVFYHPESLALNSAAILHGFTITDGNADVYPHYGGGMYNYKSSPTITNCTFSSNSIDYSGDGCGGGGMYNYQSSPTITNCIFSGNSADYEGGGMLNYDGSSPTVTSCTFSDNSVDRYGGGMCNYNSSSPIITNCTFSGNSADSYGGGGMCNSSSSPIIKNCTFSGNSAFNGGGMGNRLSSSPIITNCTFSNNSADSYGSGMWMYDYESSPIITNCIFRDNTTSTSNEIYNRFVGSLNITYCNVQGGYPGIGNIDADPLFVDPVNGDFHLGPCSPCIDAGDNSAPNLVTHDFEGNERIFNSFVDMGADEAQYTQTTYNLNIHSSGGGSVTTPGEGAFTYDCGRAVYLAAAPDDGYRFVSWTGDVADPNSMITTVIMESNKEITANFTTVDIIYVDFNTTGSNNGTSWENAYIDLQSALDDAASGTEIWVAKETYKPSTQTDPGDSRTAAFQMKNRVGIYGGFDGTEENREERDWVNNVTILSGDIGTSDDNSDNCYHVFYHPESLALNSTAILDGFTISDGNADAHDFSGRYGSGMYNVWSSPTLTNCTFLDNFAEGYGGGMHNYYSSPTLTSCIFSGNTATDGGGICNRGTSSPTVTNCLFSDNFAYTGGGIFNMGTSSPIVTNCLFSDNSALQSGGGMFNFGSSSPTVTNCTFSGNSSHIGGGMCNEGSSPIVINCTFFGNSADHGSGMCNNDYSPISHLFVLEGSFPIVTNCIFWDVASSTDNKIYNFSGSSPTITYSNIQGGYPGTGNINQDPLFVDPANGNFHLQSGSPCIDAGDNTAPEIPGLDFDGDDRIIDGDGNGNAIVDMGVDEFAPGNCAGFYSLTGTLYIPCLNLGNTSYWVNMKVVSSYLEITTFGDNGEPGSASECASFNYQSNILYIPCVYVGGISYWAVLELISSDPHRLAVEAYGSSPD